MSDNYNISIIQILVDGGYSPWGKWSACSKTCGKDSGEKTRERFCNKPQPQNGGKDCSALGKNKETKSCKPKAKKCPGEYKMKFFQNLEGC